MRRYLPPPRETPRIERRRIPGGLAGTRRTAAHVARLIREGASDFYVRQKAIDILLARRVAPKDYLGEIDALFCWVQRHVRYTKDPFRVEVLHTSRRMLELMAGDCDDMTILLGALVKSVGHPVRLVLTGPDARRPDLYSHIYLEAQHQGDWIPLDATMPFRMGWSPSAPVRLVLSVEEESNHDDSAARAAATTRSPHRPSPRAGAGLAPRAAPRDSSRGSAGARPAGEGTVGVAATPAAPRAKRVAQDDAASRVAEGAPQAAATEHHAPDGGLAQIVGRAQAAPGLHATGRRRSLAVAGDAPVPPTPSDHASARGDGAAHAASPPRPHPAREESRALSGAIEDASNLYRRFTRLPARSLERVRHRRLIPPVVVELGRLTAVIYRSGKWVGHPRTYIHYMEDPPRLVSDVAGRRLFLIGGSYRVTARGIEG